jgi:hypothetical protein
MFIDFISLIQGQGIIGTYHLATTTGMYPHTYNSPFAFAVDI